MAGALEGVRVIDFGQYIAGPLAAMLLADQGADVIRVDPPGGPRFATPANAVWNRGKRSIVLDLAEPGDAETALRLVESADVLVENFRPGVMERFGLGAEAIAAVNPRLLYLSLPGFAHDDPRAATMAWEGVVESATGIYRRPGDPIFSAIPLSSCYAAFIGVVSAVMALIAREREGVGQRIEVPLYDATFTAIGYRGQRVHDAQGATEPSLPANRAAWFGEHRTKDDRWIYFHLGNKNALDFITAVDALEWWQEADAGLQAEALFKTRTAQEWEDFAASVGTELAICRTSAEWLQHEHARGSRMIVELEDQTYGRMLQPGVQVRLSETPGTIQGPAHALDADRTAILNEARAAKPAARPASVAPGLGSVLKGMKVLDLCIVLAGPTCGRTLAEFGANVIKIDGPARPRALVGGNTNGPNSFNIEVNRGKRSIILDLRTDEGKETFWKLAADADVIVENYRAGVVDRLGIGYDEIKKRRPDIVYASLNAYGHEGPWAGRPGHEQLAQTVTGMSVRFGGDEKPVLQPVALNDFGTGIMGAYAVALALLHRQQTGRGQRVDSSLSYTACALQSLYMFDYEGKRWDEPRGQQALGLGPLQRLYRAADDWFYLGALASDLPALAGIDGLSGAAGLEGAALERYFEQRFATAPAADWAQKLQAAGAGAHVLLSVPEIMADPWARAHGLSITRHHEGFGLIDTIGPAPRLSRTPVVPGRPAPQYGADTDDILREHGLLSEKERLVSAGAVRLSL